MPSAHSYRCQASIASLPVEILLVIFKIVRDTGQMGFRPPSFPYSIASVCALWREIVVSSSQFWTRLVVSLRPGSNSFIELGLQRSGSLSFEVSLGFPFDKKASIAGDEKSCLAVAMKILLPHLHRCKALSIYIQHSSSLPPLCKLVDFLSACERLNMLSLCCHIHDVCAEPFPVVSGPVIPLIAWKFPPVTKLSLSADSIFLYNPLSDPLPFRTIQDLTLSDYDARICPRGEHGLSLSSLLEMLRTTRAKSIRLIKLYFHPEDDLVIVPVHAYSPRLVHCENLQGDVVSAICLLYADRWVEKLCIELSPIDSVELFPALVLDLVDIIEGDFPHGVFRTLSSSTLYVHGCPSFDNSILEEITKGCFEMYELPLTELWISCCPVSVTGLKCLVIGYLEGAKQDFKRKKNRDMEEHEFSMLYPLMELTVEEEIGALFSEEDLEWFKSNVVLKIY